MSKDAVVTVAKERRDGDSDIRTLSTGIKVRLKAVNASTITEVMARLEPPKPPLWFNKSKGRQEQNQNDPYYLELVNKFAYLQSETMFDTLLMFGVELVDGLPEDEEWLKKLRFLDKRGRFDLSAYDLDDDLDKEFLFKKHVAVGTADWATIMAFSGISQEAIEAASRGFPGDQAQDADS